MAKIRQEDRTPVLGRILKYLKPYWWLLTLALLCAVATVTCTLTGPVLVGNSSTATPGPAIGLSWCISCKIHPAWANRWSIASRAFCSGVIESTSDKSHQFLTLYHNF